MQMKRFPYILIILSLLCITAAPASAKLGLSLGADLGFDCYSKLKYAAFYPTRLTGNFYLTYAIREDWHLGAGSSITKIYFDGLVSAAGMGRYSMPLYDIGPVLTYTVWSGIKHSATLCLKPSLRYVWGYMYDDTEQYNRVGTYRGYNARLNVRGNYGILEVQFGYDFSKVKLYDKAIKEAWFDQLRLNTLDLSGPNVSVGVNIAP